MNLALDEAWRYQLLTYPNPAVGCCIVDNDNAILAVEAHQKAGEAHAEVLALQSAYIKLTNDTEILTCKSSHEIHDYLLHNHNGCFKNSTLHVTLEPCSHEGKTPSCAKLISTLGVKKVIVASKDESQNAKGGCEILSNSNVETDFSSLHVSSDALLYPFLKWSNERFVFFKWAQRLDGTLDGGTISSLKSRTLVHEMRARCDLLIIGGETVRTDRPTLDARLCDGKAPDVLIVSRSKEFDETIPLFSVPNRKVIIADNFDAMKNYNCIMIEGGANMFVLSKDYVDYCLTFIAPKTGGKQSFASQVHNFEILHSQQLDEDLLLWMKLKN
jgi:diaminohydroxyphosphoribosylaminopyrimidine deaminase/5-amino-6-(5-phosphoribosylamino)uracil reductase